jgi:hypothetical protein
MTYDEIIKNLQTLLEIPLNQEDENFKRIIPLMLAYAENRIIRELDFLAATTSTMGTLIANNREITLPATLVILRQMSVLTPTGYPWQNFFTRRPLERISPEALDLFGTEISMSPGVPPSAVLLTRGIPIQYAIIGNGAAALSYTVRLWPTPDQPYPVEFLGVIRPPSLSPTNIETVLSMIYPDLLCAACMVFASGYQRDFGAMADDPQKAMTWEAMYTTLRAGAMLEIARQKGEGPGWSAVSPAPAAQPRAP